MKLTEYADVEIRILDQQAQGYPVEITLNGHQQFERGYLSPNFLPWTGSRSISQDGQVLFDWLTESTAVKVAWGQIRGQHPAFRIRLRLDATAPELHALPWELLHDTTTPHGAKQIAAEADRPFARYLAGTWQVHSAIKRRPIKLLVVIANPTGLEEYDLQPLDERVERQIIDAVQQDLVSGQLKITYLEGPITLPKIEQELRKGYDFVHLVAHGIFQRRRKRGAIFLADDGNQVQVVDDEVFAAMIDRLAGPPKLVFLATCQSASRSPADAFRGVAPQLVQAGISAVVAMQDLVPVETAQLFGQVFYRQLFQHGIVDLAVNEARATLITAQQPGSTMPVLFNRLPDGRLLAEPNPNELVVIKRQPFEPETVLIPSGTFLMGTQLADAPDHEKPQHTVTLDSYRMGKYPVTHDEYAAFLKQTRHRPPRAPRLKRWLGSRPPKGLNNHPVVGVTWHEAMDYCQWLSEKTGRSYRLPTEAEWEKAARGTDGRTYPWGNEWLNTCCSWSNTSTSPVDAFPEGVSPYGCYGMIGNTWEWTTSLWGREWREPDYPYPYQPHDGREDIEAGNEVFRVYRGGDYDDDLKHLRTTARRWYAPDNADRTRGFRVVMDVD